MRRQKPVKITTPTGIAQWPRLNSPDGKFDKANPVYHVKLRLPGEEAEVIIKTMKKAHLENIEQIKSDTGKSKVKEAPFPVKDVEDQDGNPTGDVEINFKLKSIGISGEDRWDQRPLLYDAKGNPVTEVIGGGSLLRVAAEIVPYFVASIGAGVSLRLKAVQVVELRAKDGDDSFDSWDFTKEEGFVSSGEEQETVSAETESTDEDESGFDF